MEHYLYGLTIHSIQGYIFQTNKLKEIAGASELVEQICTELFAEIIKKENFEELKTDPNAIRNAAGNIRYVFTKEDDCRRVVKNFPKQILETAPGISICQAVVKMEGFPTTNDFELLENKLTSQRNNPIRPVDLGYLAINRSRRTGLPSKCKVLDGDGKVPVDRATKLKQEQKTLRVNKLFFQDDFDETRITNVVEKITESKNKNYSWLAVIHADGNNMGQALQDLNKEELAKKDYKEASKTFSSVIDKSTKAAAHYAFVTSMSKKELEGSGVIPFRPIIVGGDDLTVVCRADLALKFTQYYLEKFEKQTEENFTSAGFTTNLKNGLSACAGIAFIKVNYPFHYAVELAEKLCAHAKKDAKNKTLNNGLTPSCLMFHKVQDSFVESYIDIVERELTALESNCRFDFGPYYTSEKMGTQSIKNLSESVEKFKGKEGNAIKSGLRQWLSELHNNRAMAEQRMNRLLSVGKQEILTGLKLNDDTKGIYNGKSPVYDWLTILSINQNNENDDNN
jgi:hypothetical protein